MARRAALESPTLPQLQDQVSTMLVKLVRLITDEPDLDVGVSLADYNEPDGSRSYRFWVVVPGHKRGYLIGTRGSMAEAIRTQVRSYCTMLDCRDDVDVRVQKGD